MGGSKVQLRLSEITIRYGEELEQPLVKYLVPRQLVQHLFLSVPRSLSLGDFYRKFGKLDIKLSPIQSEQISGELARNE